MEKKKSLLIVEDEGQLFQEFQSIQPDLTPVQTHYSEIKETLDRVSPCAVVFNMDHQKDQIRELLNHFHKTHPNTHWVLSGGEITKEELIDFMRLGISDYLTQPVNPRDMRHLIDRLQSLSNGNGHHAPEPVKEHQIITFFSPKGGVGLSFSAVNFCTTLAKRNLEKVLLVDLVLQHGNIAELLDLTANYTVHDLAENLERVDTKLLDHSLAKHKSGVYVLPCPKHPEDSESFASKEIQPMLKIFKEAFTYTVIDAGHELNSATIACLDMADSIFVMATPDLPSLCNTKTVLETFAKFGYKKEKIKLVLNRSGMKGEIDSKVIEKNLGYKVDFRIADDQNLALNAINQGIPVKQLSKNAALVKNFEELVDHTAGSVKKAA